MIMSVELSAVTGEGGEITTCNSELEKTEMFSVYIKNPLAFHIQDFYLKPMEEKIGELDFEKRVREANRFLKPYGEAKMYAEALSSHLGCPLEIMIERFDIDSFVY